VILLLTVMVLMYWFPLALHAPQSTSSPDIALREYSPDQSAPSQSAPQEGERLRQERHREPFPPPPPQLRPGLIDLLFRSAIPLSLALLVAVGLGLAWWLRRRWKRGKPTGSEKSLDEVLDNVESETAAPAEMFREQRMAGVIEAEILRRTATRPDGAP
jgi:hypothetical protein